MDDMNPQLAELREMMRDFDDVSKLNSELQLYVEPEGKFTKHPLRHPLVYHVIGPMLPHHLNAMFEMKKKAVKKALSEKDWPKLIWLHERPYRMTLIEQLYDDHKISVDKMRELLLTFWTDTEIPQNNQQEPLYLFREAGFATDDQEAFDKLPRLLTLYRGVDGVCELTPDGPSWTLDRKVADFFAKRYATGRTYRYRIIKDHPAVLAYITGRNESEIILDFDKLDAHDIDMVKDFNGV